MLLKISGCGMMMRGSSNIMLVRGLNNPVLSGLLMNSGFINCVTSHNIAMNLKRTLVILIQ